MIRKAIYFSLLTAFVSGISVFVNGMFVTKADPVVFAFVRNVIVSIILSAVLIGSKSLNKIRSLSHREWRKLVLIGAIGGGIPFALFFTGLAKIGAVNGTIIHKSLFLWVAFMAVPFLGEALSWVTIAGYGLIFLATFVYGGSFAFVPSVGSFMVLGATILWAIEQIIAKRTLASVPPAIVAWGRMVFGLPFLFGSLFVFGKASILSVAFVTYFALSIFVSAVLLTMYVMTWYQALKRAPATLVSSVLVLAPVITIALQSGILHKPFRIEQLWSLAVAAIGVVCVAFPFVKSHREKI